MFKSSTKYRNQFTICIFSKAALFRNILPAVFVYMYMFFIRNISVGKVETASVKHFSAGFKNKQTKMHTKHISYVHTKRPRVYFEKRPAKL